MEQSIHSSSPVSLLDNPTKTSIILTGVFPDTLYRTFNFERNLTNIGGRSRYLYERSIIMTGGWQVKSVLCVY